jgi:hypothetical protein
MIGARQKPNDPGRSLMRASVARFLFGSAMIFILSGCATLTVVPAERLAGQQLTPAAAPVAHIYADNWGIYLFKYLPLITGSLSRPGVPRFPALFSDQVRIDLLVEKVSEESKTQGGTVLTDLRTRDRSYYMSWTLILWLNEFEVSANASRAP